jgi:Domain of unknown function (DUF4375)
MPSKFLPPLKLSLIKDVQTKPDSVAAIYDLLTIPLAEELYHRQTFDFFDELSEGQQLLLSYEYVQNQVLQGGFIQLIQNGYIGLLPDLPEWLEKVDAKPMAKVIDDVLKVYVLNREALEKKTSVEEFAQLYNEFQEFEMLEDEFLHHNEATLGLIIKYALNHLPEFCTLNTD